MKVFQELKKRALAAPAVALVLVCIVAPMCVTLYSSVRQGSHWSLQNYREVFTTPATVEVLKITLVISISVTILSVAICAPACAFFAKKGKRAANVFLAVVGISFSISVLIRTFAWQVLLAYNGALNSILVAIGILPHRSHMLYTRNSVIIAMVQTMLPYAALVLFSGMRRVDHRLLFAARTLGASPLRTFREAYWPQVKGSVSMAIILVFTLSAGYFVTPALLGGPSDEMIGMLMQSEISTDYLNGSSRAAAVGVMLGLVLLVVTLLVMRISRGSLSDIAKGVRS